jgi:hypothetical protein
VAYGSGTFAAKIECVFDHASRSDRYNYECICDAKSLFAVKYPAHGLMASVESESGLLFRSPEDAKLADTRWDC